MWLCQSNDLQGLPVQVRSAMEKPQVKARGYTWWVDDLTNCSWCTCRDSRGLIQTRGIPAMPAHLDPQLHLQLHTILLSSSCFPLQHSWFLECLKHARRLASQHLCTCSSPYLECSSLWPQCPAGSQLGEACFDPTLQMRWATLVTWSYSMLYFPS